MSARRRARRERRERETVAELTAVLNRAEPFAKSLARLARDIDAGLYDPDLIAPILFRPAGATDDEWKRMSDDFNAKHARRYPPGCEP